MKKICLGLAAVLLLVVTASGPASGQTDGGAAPEAVSSPYTRFDPIGDTTFQKGDITAWQIVHRTDVVKLTIRLRVSTDLATWQPFSICFLGGCVRLSRGALWSIDVDADGQPDYQLWADYRGARFVHYSVEGTPLPSCAAWLVHNERYVYVLGFRRSCIGSPASFRAEVKMYWYNLNAGRSVDVAPDHAPAVPFGWSPAVSP